MTIVPGTRLGRYEIRAKIGEGGMGEVHLARDTKLNRDVAIKVLPAAFSADVDRLRRFEQEAQAASALNHPNILSVYDFGEHDGAPYVVSELLEGETLRARLGGHASRGSQSSSSNHTQFFVPLAQSKAIDYGLQIAHGLAAAHAKGIVHRDLKPENLFITNDGRVKILDFGLAKLTGMSDGTQSQTEVPTLPVDTDPGVVMGTVGYISPEQLRGRPADNRSDIFSFGAILYEMLSGTRAFHGESRAETMSAILREDPPDLAETNKAVSPALDRLVNHCLEKNPDERFHSARDLAFALESLSGSTGGVSQTSAISAFALRSMKRREQMAWITAGVFLLGLLTVWMWAMYLPRTPKETRATYVALLRQEKTELPTATNPGLAIAPDGRRLVMVAVSEGNPRLWLYSFDSPKWQALPRTEGASFPFWSPDSRSIGFFAQGKLRKIEVASGLPTTLCDAPQGFGGTWSSDGVIVFAPNQLGTGLHRVSDGGGVATPVTTIDTKRQELGHNFPYFLPDGRHFVYLALNAQPENRGICVGSLDQGETRRLVRADSNVAYAPPGYLLFARARKLMAQPFDPKRLEVTGDPFTVAEQIRYLFSRYADLSVSASGVLAYASGNDLGHQLIWYDRGGRQLGTVGALGEYRHLDLSRDDKRVLLERFDPQVETADDWVLDLLRDMPDRLTSDPSNDSSPLWSPDGTRFIFAAAREGGPASLYQKAASGPDQEQLLLKPGTDSKWPSDWSRDGRFIIYVQLSQKTQYDLWILPTFGDRQPRPYLASEFSEFNGRVSPDGRWMSYTSNEDGSNQVFVQSFPEPGRKVQISKGGGSHARWRNDGKELFYLAADNKLMAVAVKESSGFEAGPPTTLFEMSGLDRNFFRYPYAVAADGQRFLLLKPVEEAASRPLTIVQNWTAMLKR
jgi:serine/threonine protein kinase/Tol biopolymer transport system component